MGEKYLSIFEGRGTEGGGGGAEDGRGTEGERRDLSISNVYEHLIGEP